MNITIAVALITACSTLTGGAIASITTLMAQGKQLRHQAALAKADQASQLSDKRREVRRAAYVELLAKLDEAELQISSCWKKPELTEDYFTEVHAVVRSLRIPVNIVSMEGPLIMTALAPAIYLIFQEELIRVHQIFEKNKDIKEALINNRSNEFDSSFGRRFQIRSNFVETAREVLSDPSEGLEEGHIIVPKNFAPDT